MRDLVVGVGGLMGLPPPPGGGGGGVGSGRIPGPPPGASSLTPMQSPSEPVAPPVINSGTTNTAAAASSNVDLLGDLLGSAAIAPVTTQVWTPTQSFVLFDHLGHWLRNKVPSTCKLEHKTEKNYTAPKSIYILVNNSVSNY